MLRQKDYAAENSPFNDIPFKIKLTFDEILWVAG